MHVKMRHLQAGQSSFPIFQSPDISCSSLPALANGPLQPGFSHAPGTLSNAGSSSWS